MKASDRISSSSFPTINDEIRALLEDLDFAADALGDLTSFLGNLRTQDAGDRKSLDELLTISGVPVWELLQHELFQILEPALYRGFVAKAAVDRHVGDPIVVRDENSFLARAVRLFAAAAGKRTRVVRSLPSDFLVPKEESSPTRQPPFLAPRRSSKTA